MLFTKSKQFRSLETSPKRPYFWGVQVALDANAGPGPAAELLWSFKPLGSWFYKHLVPPGLKTGDQKIDSCKNCGVSY